MSCRHKIHEGTVIEKWYEPPNEYTTVTYIPNGGIMVPITHYWYDGEDYAVKVKGEFKGRPRTETFYVTEWHWKQLKVGGCFNDSIPCSVRDKNNTEQ